MIRPHWLPQALEFVRKRQGPVLAGEVALHLGPYCSLKDAEEVLGLLVQEGKIRFLTAEELRFKDYRLGYIAV